MFFKKVQMSLCIRQIVTYVEKSLCLPMEKGGKINWEK